jgi:DNA-binding IclR family transcriptional regulator
MKKEGMSEGNSIQSVERAMRILELLCMANEPLSVIEISQKVGVNRTTVYGILNTFVKMNYAERGKARGKFVDSYKVFMLGSAYQRKLALPRQAAVYLNNLFYKYQNASVRLAMKYGPGAYVIVDAKEAGRSAIIRAGEIIPLHAAAMGKAILAFQPEEEIELFLSGGPLCRYTSTTLTAPGQLREELAKTRARGYATDDGEYLDNTFCMAFPVRNSSGQVFAAMSVSSNKNNIVDNLSELILDGLENSKALSKELGWRVTPG